MKNEKPVMKKYRFLVDNGLTSFTLETTASSEEQARKQITWYEQCPDSALTLLSIGNVHTE